MSKRLLIEARHKEGKTKIGILHQSHRCESFAKNGKFVASNGFIIASGIEPSIPDNNTLLVLGEDKRKDTVTLDVPSAQYFSKLKAAVAEYNNVFKTEGTTFQIVTF